MRGAAHLLAAEALFPNACSNQAGCSDSRFGLRLRHSSVPFRRSTDAHAVAGPVGACATGWSSRIVTIALAEPRKSSVAGEASPLQRMLGHSLGLGLVVPLEDSQGAKGIPAAG